MCCEARLDLARPKPNLPSRLALWAPLCFECFGLRCRGNRCGDLPSCAPGARTSFGDENQSMTQSSRMLNSHSPTRTRALAAPAERSRMTAAPEPGAAWLVPADMHDGQKVRAAATAAPGGQNSNRAAGDVAREAIRSPRTQSRCRTPAFRHLHRPCPNAPAHHDLSPLNFHGPAAAFSPTGPHPRNPGHPAHGDIVF